MSLPATLAFSMSILASRAPYRTGLILSLPETDKFYMTYNNAKTIQVQDQVFADWITAWQQMKEIGDKATQKGYAIDLVTQQIEDFNTLSKSAVELGKLMNEDCLTIGIEKDEKKDLRQGLGSYVKAAKTNLK